jgi:hypothetical protein
MAASLQVNASMTLTDTGVNESSNPGTKTITPTTSNNQSGVFPVPTSAAAIPLGGIVPGYCQITNLDAANYMQVLTATGGTAFCKLLPGETAVFRFDPGLTAPFWQAHTATVRANILIVDGS